MILDGITISIAFKVSRMVSTYTQPIGYVVRFTQLVLIEKQLFQTQGVSYPGEGVESFWVFVANVLPESASIKIKNPVNQ